MNSRNCANPRLHSTHGLCGKFLRKRRKVFWQLRMNKLRPTQATQQSTEANVYASDPRAKTQWWKPCLQGAPKKNTSLVF